VPELPDVDVYVRRIGELFGGQPLRALRIASPFVLRSVTTPVADLVGKPLSEVSRLGKRIVLRFGDAHFAIVHLMISGRFHLKPLAKPIPKRVGLLAFDFLDTAMVLTEQSTQKRASLHLAEGHTSLAEFERGGLEPLSCTAQQLAARLSQENRTLKRALTDPTYVSGVGNAYSDEILHAAKLSPIARTQTLTPEAWQRLHAAMQQVLVEWRQRLLAEVGDGFPEKVTAFHPQMAVHGKYNQPCPVCQTLVQRVRYAANELNYCPRCQTGGKLLADRSLSRLLKGDWPKTIEELEYTKSR
jgi:formamidopyrimidine-DNA glycosylase